MGVVEPLHASEAVELGVRAIAADAVDEEELSSLLGDAGFESAVERRYAGDPHRAIRRVEVRVVRFAAVDGADRYLEWLRDHVRDQIGVAAPADWMLGPSMSVSVHVPDGCCPKDTALALASWRDGRDVLRVLVVGPGADGTNAVRLIESVQRWVATS